MKLPKKLTVKELKERTKILLKAHDDLMRRWEQKFIKQISQK